MDIKTVNFHTKYTMEVGIQKMKTLGWKVKDSEFFPYTIKDKLLNLILPWRGGWLRIREGGKSGYFQVAFTIDLNAAGTKDLNAGETKMTRLKEPVNDWFNWGPRWLKYGVLAAVASLIALGVLSIFGDGMFWGFGFVAPAAILELLIFGIEGSGVVTEYFILISPVIWFVIGAVIGKIISLPRFESINENSKLIISAAILFVIIVFGFIAMIMIGLGA